MRTEKNLMVAMPDGVKLATNLYLPDDKATGPWPVILVRTPYDTETLVMGFEQITSDGYVVVTQDVRGRFASEGEFRVLENEQRDGVATINWLREQPWCNGKIGGCSGSYLGATQWLPALQSPEGYVTAMPVITASIFDGFAFHSRGVIQLDVMLLWTAFLADDANRRRGIDYSDEHAELKAMRKSSAHLVEQVVAMITLGAESEEGGKIAAQIPAMMAGVETKTRAFLALPLATQVQQILVYAPWLQDWIDHIDQPDAPFWTPFDWSQHYDKINIPMNHSAGWHDLFIRGQLKDYAALTARSDIPFQKIVVGPEFHGCMFFEDEVIIGERMLNSPCIVDSYLPNRSPAKNKGQLSSRWYQQHLKGEDSGILEEAPVTLFVQGEDVWRDEQEWPLARTEYRPLYLHSDGQLNLDKPAEQFTSNPADQFTYDPANPVPAKGGTFLNMGIAPGIFEQSEVEARDDVLVYTTAPLEQDLEVTGPIAMKLWASTSAVDTDFTARLAVVDSEGKSWGICDGVTRLRFRKEQPGLIEPGSLQEMEIELSPTSYLFKAGERIRVQVSSSNFPLFDPNPNTGKNLLTDTSNKMIVAEQTVFHDAMRPSHLLLPVIPR